MLKLKKFKLQITFEYFIGFSILLLIFFIFFYIYLDSYKKLNDLIQYINLENECHLFSWKFNSFFPIILRNISYYEIFEVETDYEIEIKNYRIKIGNVSCYTKIEEISGKIKKGKNIIVIENGSISIFQI